jgi:CSLREA domain-containing protein
LNADPKLAPLADNGGFTQMMALQPGSPAINAGSDADCSLTDQRGIGRPQGPHCDIGAYEFVPAAPVILAVTKTVDTDDGICNEDCSLREAISNSYDGDTIKFSVSGNIVLGSSLPAINKRLVIDGSEQKIYLDGASSYRIFKVTQAGNLTVKNMTFQNGKPAAPCEFDIDMPSCGGAIYTDGSLTVINSTFSGNTAGTGGAIWIGAGTANIESSTFKGNSVTSTGGAILNLLGVANIINSTFYGNTAGELGGAILNDINLLNLKSNTFSNNSAALGGAVYNSAGTMTFANNILANSTSGGDCYNEYPWGEISLNANNLIETNAASPNRCGSPSFIADPKLGPLADNDGPTQTMALLPGSPAINTGEDANCAASDQRGIIRPQGIHCDIGAYEREVTNVDVTIGGELKDNYDVLFGDRIYPQFPGVFDGPVQVASTNGIPFLTTERALYGDSFNESIGLPTDERTTEYWFPWYDDVNMGTWITVGNPGTGQTATVEIYIAGVKRGTYSIPSNGQITPNFPGIFDGPVRVISTNGVKIIASARSLYQGSFTDILGYPAVDFATSYWFPWYRYDSGLQTWVSVGNPSSSQTANVEIYIAGVLKGSQTIPPNGRWTPSFNNLSAGPVQVVSTNGVKILASQRLLYQNSFNEIFGVPESQMSTEYWISWYDSTNMTSQILVGNPSTSQSASVDIYIGGVKKGSQSILPGKVWVSSYPNMFQGPVKIVSTNGVKVFTSEQSIYNTSFEESLGFPLSRVSTEYWFLWYDQRYMDTWLTIAVP